MRFLLGIIAFISLIFLVVVYLSPKKKSVKIEAFVSFPCSCGEQVELFKPTNPGQVAVLECDNCHLSWTVHNPQLTMTPTKDLPENLQSVWAQLASESN